MYHLLDKSSEGKKSNLSIFSFILSFCGLIFVTNTSLAAVEKVTIERNAYQSFIVTEPQIQTQDDLNAYIEQAKTRLSTVAR